MIAAVGKIPAGGCRSLAIALALYANGVQAQHRAENEAACAKIEKKMSKPGFWADVGAGMAASMVNTHTNTAYYSGVVGGQRYGGRVSVSYTDRAAAQRDYEQFSAISQRKRMAKLEAEFEKAGCHAEQALPHDTEGK